MSAAPKCPICGGRITYSSDSFRVLRGGCLPCGWQTLNGWYTVVNRDNAVLEFISKFPPIMRVHPGDQIMTYSGHIRTVVKRLLWCGKLEVTAAYKDDHAIKTIEVSVFDVMTWPWEIDQTGGKA